MAAVATRLRLKLRKQEDHRVHREAVDSRSSIGCGPHKQSPTFKSDCSGPEASSSACSELLSGCATIQALPRVSKRPQLLLGLNSGRTEVQPTIWTATAQQKLFRLKPEFGRLTPRTTFPDNSVSRLSSDFFDIEEKNSTNGGNPKDASQAVSELNLPSLDRSDTNAPELCVSEENFLIPVVDSCEQKHDQDIPPSQSAPSRPLSSSKATCDELLQKHLPKPLDIEEHTFRKLIAPLKNEGARKPILRSSGRFSSRHIESRKLDSRIEDSGHSIPYTLVTESSQKRVQFAKNKIIKIFRRSDIETEH